MNLDIDYTYDSHVHFFGTGIPAVEWDLKTQNEIPKHLLNSNLVRGFGWNDDSYFLNEVSKYEDLRFFLSKIDGHTVYISKNLVDDFNIDHSEFETFGDLGFLIKENERDFIERLLPKRTFEDLKKMALYAQDLFLSKNIRKVRHLTCTQPQWQVLRTLEVDSLIKIEIECFFSEFMDQTFEEAIEAYAEAKETNRLKPKGLKIFYDGSFGSKTAYSKIFPNIEPRISLEQLKNRVEVAFELECDIAIHTIGEKAVEDSIKVFKEIFLELESNETRLHLEHCPALSSADINNLKELNAVLHLQPSHFEGDKIFLRDLSKLDLHIYPFNLLLKNKIDFHFGSDSPVSNPLNKDEYTEILKSIGKEF